MNNQEHTILIVDDNKINQNLMQKTLNSSNYVITIAKNGLQALEILADNDFDLVCLDLDMPLMDGISCIQNIRNLSEKKKASIPVIACTGNNLDLSIKEFEQVGFTDVVFKPIDCNELYRKINKYLGK